MPLRRPGTVYLGELPEVSPPPGYRFETDQYGVSHFVRDDTPKCPDGLARAMKAPLNCDARSLLRDIE